MRHEAIAPARWAEAGRSLRLAQAVALLIPAVLLAGAWGSQLFGGLYPCEMCHWQRWPHYAALVPAALAFAVAGRAQVALVASAALLIAVSGAIGLFHAGVEYHWWQGVTTCASTVAASGDPLAAILNAPIVRCDVPQWTFAGVSLAGFNAIFSLGGALAILALLRRAR